MPDAPPDSTARGGDLYVPRGQNFEVVLLKKGVAGHVATPEDFRRVNVFADSIGAAYDDDAVVEASKTHDLVRATAPGMLTQDEIQALQRARLGADGALDRSKI